MKKVKLTKLKFHDILQKEDGIIKGPFGGDIKKAYFVPEDKTTYKIYEQGVVYNSNINYGSYYISAELYNKLNKFAVKSGDLLLTGAGTLGEIFEIPKEYKKGIINQALIRIRLNEKIINKEYFKYYFKWYIKDIVCRINGNSVIPNLPPLNVLKETEIAIPNLNDQNKISAVLNSIDSKITLNNKINVELESMAKTIYDYWFTQFDFPDENGRPYKSSSGKMEWNEELQRDIPAGWEVKKLDDCGNFKNGINYEKNCDGDKTVRIINVRNISESTCYILPDNLDLITLPEASLQQYIAEKDDILIARSGIPGATRLLINNQETVIYCGFIIRYKVNVLCEKIYLYQTIKQYEQRNIAQAAGTVLKNVSQDILKNITIIEPPKEFIDNFNRIENPFYEKMKRITEENQNLMKIRDWILPMLMNDQIEI